jgi:hypothetical protein
VRALKTAIAIRLSWLFAVGVTSFPANKGRIGPRVRCEGPLFKQVQVLPRQRSPHWVAVATRSPPFGIACGSGPSLPSAVEAITAISTRCRRKAQPAAEGCRTTKSRGRTE